MKDKPIRKDQTTFSITLPAAYVKRIQSAAKVTRRSRKAETEWVIMHYLEKYKTYGTT